MLPVVTSFFDLVLFKPKAAHFIGLQNFVTLLHDPVFWSSLWRTVLWIGLTVPAQMLLGLVAVWIGVEC